MDFQGYPLNCILISQLVTCVSPIGSLSLIKLNFFGAGPGVWVFVSVEVSCCMDITTGSDLDEYAQNSQNFAKLRKTSAEPDTLAMSRLNLWVLKGRK